jgi:hypothetical protein
MVTAHADDDEGVENMEEVEVAGACAFARPPARNKISSMAAFAQVSFLVDLCESKMSGSRIGIFRSMPPV